MFESYNPLVSLNTPCGFKGCIACLENNAVDIAQGKSSYFNDETLRAVWMDHYGDEKWTVSAMHTVPYVSNWKETRTALETRGFDIHCGPPANRNHSGLWRRNVPFFTKKYVLEPVLFAQNCSLSHSGLSAFSTHKKSWDWLRLAASSRIKRSWWWQSLSLSQGHWQKNDTGDDLCNNICPVVRHIVSLVLITGSANYLQKRATINLLRAGYERALSTAALDKLDVIIQEMLYI